MAITSILCNESFGGDALQRKAMSDKSTFIIIDNTRKINFLKSKNKCKKNVKRKKKERKKGGGGCQSP